MHSYANDTLVADRQPRYMQVADHHPLITNRPTESPVHGVHRFANQIWAVVHASRTFRRPPSPAVPSSTALGS